MINRSKRIQQKLLILSFLTGPFLLSVGCQSPSSGPVENSTYQSIPAPFRKNGMISSSTYQVYVETKADSEEKAKINGEALARTTAFRLLTNESFARIRISEYGRRKIKDLIEKEGSIVRISQIKENRWGISYQIYRNDLREYLMTIR